MSYDKVKVINLLHSKVLKSKEDQETCLYYLVPKQFIVVLSTNFGQIANLSSESVTHWNVEQPLSNVIVSSMNI